jgi:hypothetical protein
MTCKVYCPTEVVQDIGVVPEEGYNPYFFPAEGAYLPFFFTAESFVKVLSALVNGANVTYGDEGRAVVWEFLRNVEYPMPFCEQLIECITNDQDVRDAIADLVMSDPRINDYFSNEVQRLTAGQITGSIMTGSCDESNIAGQVIAIIDAIDTYNVDALEIVEVGTNDEERLSTFLSGFPAIGLLPADEALDTMQDWLEDFAEGYNAAITPEWKDDVAEDLYCIAKGMPDCSLTYEALFNYFQTRANSGLSLLTNALDIAQFLADGDFNNDELVASGMYAVMLSGILTGRNYFGLTLPAIGALTRDAEPSSAWEEWDECDEPTPEDCYDFTSGEHSFIPYFNGVSYYAAYSAGNGWEPEVNPGIIKIRRLSMSGVITSVTIRFSEAVPSGVNNIIVASNVAGSNVAYEEDVDTDEVILPGTSITGGLDIELTFDGTLPSTFYIQEVCVEFAP